MPPPCRISLARLAFLACVLGTALAGVVLAGCPRSATDTSLDASRSSNSSDSPSTSPVSSVSSSASRLTSGPVPQPDATPSLAVSAASVSTSTSGVGTAPRTFESLGLTITHIYPEKHFSWRQIEQLHWQAIPDGLATLAAEAPVDSKSCPSGMILVEGKFLLDSRGKEDSDEVQLAQNQACAHWRTEDHGVNGLCDRVDPERWKALASKLPTRPLKVCMDRYEFPDIYGEFPLVVTTFAESEAHCARQGKRLCTESEWTFACEGDEGLAYPYGYSRDPSICNIDVFGPGPAKDTFSPRTTALTAQGVDNSWRGRRSGESPLCRSPFGVEDMTGNVDEWTRTVRPYGYKMIMKGGHWGPARQRCRPQTRGHGPHYIRYDQGFRCCRDAE